MIYQEHATALHSAVVLPIRVSKQCTDFIGGAPLISDQCGCRWAAQVFRSAEAAISGCLVALRVKQRECRWIFLCEPRVGAGEETNGRV
jgi:hypothetical protein